MTISGEALEQLRQQAQADVRRVQAKIVWMMLRLI